MLGHGQQSEEAPASWDGFQDRIRNPSLTLLLVLELSSIFFAAPLAAKGLPLAEKILDVSTWTMIVLTVVLSRRWGAIVLIALALVLLSADLSQMVWLPVAPSVLGRAGSILGLGALTWVVLRAVFAPGRNRGLSQPRANLCLCLSADLGAQSRGIQPFSGFRKPARRFRHLALLQPDDADHNRLRRHLPG